MHILVTPVFPLDERKQETRTTIQQKKPIDSKVRGVVLERMAHAKGGLLPSASAPEIIMGLLPGFEAGKAEEASRKNRRAKLWKTPHAKKSPIGLQPVDPEGWLNALMQFILYVPGFSESFSFAPRSFQPIQEFIDHYLHDQQENKAVCTASGIPLFRFFSMRFPGFCLREIFRYLVCLLHPKWAVHGELSEALQLAKSDLFVTGSSLKKQIFCEPELYYDLGAFIEMRPDGMKVSYVAYVKVDGGWYQCDETRITQIRSDSLTLPMQRGILFHYKRILLGSARWY